MGLIYDSTGSYLPNLYWLASVAVIAAPLMALAVRLGRRKWDRLFAAEEAA
jgi:hypothetical protein